MKHLIKALLVIGLIGSIAAVFHPDTPLRDAWNPIKPLRIDDPVTSLTQWKMRAALGDDDLCLRVLQQGADMQPEAPLTQSDDCYITPRITLSRVGQGRLNPVETRCQTALRLAMWERHGLQAAAERHLGTTIREIRHFSSYSCRKIRTGSGNNSRMSTHATANAIDISGFVLSDGRQVDLKKHWPKIGPKSDFLRDAFQAACLWFPVALGPEFNALHADHFHLQTRGWGLCR